MELYLHFEEKQKNGLSSLRVIFPKLLKILLNKIFLLDDYLAIANYFLFPVYSGDEDSVSFSYFIDLLQFKPVENWPVLLKYIKEVVKDPGVLQPFFRIWLEVSDRFLLGLSSEKPKTPPFNLFLQFRIEKKHYHAFLKFIQKFYKVNLESISLEKVDSIRFFLEEESGFILNFLESFGVNFIKSIESDINKSVLPLQKKLISLSILKELSTKILLKHLTSFQSNFSVSKIYDVQNCLLLFDTLAELKMDKQFNDFKKGEEYWQYKRYKANISLNEFLAENEKVNSIEIFLNNLCKSILSLLRENDFKIEDQDIKMF